MAVLWPCVADDGLAGTRPARRTARAARAVAAGLDPNYSRLLFAPTGRPLAKGDGYFSDYELVFPGVAYGLTDNLSLAGGVSVIPGLGLGEQLFYVSPKLGCEPRRPRGGRRWAASSRARRRRRQRRVAGASASRSGRSGAATAA